MIDTHHHFWNYSKQDYGWISDDMSVLQKDYLPANLKAEMEKVGVSGVVSVQARQSLAETDMLLKWAGEHDFIKGVVGWVDLCSPDVEEQLKQYTTNKKFVGVRHVLQDEVDDRYMLREDFLRGIDLLSRYNLTYDILIFPRHLPIAVEFVRQFPNHKFVLDHLAKPYIKRREIRQWQADIESLAAFSNVHCKISGMVTEADWQAWRPEDFTPYMKVVEESFGYDRIMLGSDWPVCLLAGSYTDVWNIPLQYFQQLPEAVFQNVTELNGRKFYGLE